MLKSFLAKFLFMSFICSLAANELIILPDPSIIEKNDLTRSDCDIFKFNSSLRSKCRKIVKNLENPEELTRAKNNFYEKQFSIYQNILLASESLKNTACLSIDCLTIMADANLSTIKEYLAATKDCNNCDCVQTKESVFNIDPHSQELESFKSKLSVPYYERLGSIYKVMANNAISSIANNVAVYSSLGLDYQIPDSCGLSQIQNLAKSGCSNGYQLSQESKDAFLGLPPDSDLISDLENSLSDRLKPIPNESFFEGETCQLPKQLYYQFKAKENIKNISNAIKKYNACKSQYPNILNDLFTKDPFYSFAKNLGAIDDSFPQNERKNLFEKINSQCRTDIIDVNSPDVDKKFSDYQSLSNRFGYMQLANFYWAKECAEAGLNNQFTREIYTILETDNNPNCIDSIYDSLDTLDGPAGQAFKDMALGDTDAFNTLANQIAACSENDESCLQNEIKSTLASYSQNQSYNTDSNLSKVCSNSFSKVNDFLCSPPSYPNWSKTTNLKLQSLDSWNTNSIYFESLACSMPEDNSNPDRLDSLIMDFLESNDVDTHSSINFGLPKSPYDELYDDSGYDEFNTQYCEKLRSCTTNASGEKECHLATTDELNGSTDENLKSFAQLSDYTDVMENEKSYRDLYNKNIKNKYTSENYGATSAYHQMMYGQPKQVASSDEAKKSAIEKVSTVTQEPIQKGYQAQFSQSSPAKATKSAPIKPKQKFSNTERSNFSASPSSKSEYSSSPKQISSADSSYRDEYSKVHSQLQSTKQAIRDLQEQNAHFADGRLPEKQNESIASDFSKQKSFSSRQRASSAVDSNLEEAVGSTGSSSDKGKTQISSKGGSSTGSSTATQKSLDSYSPQELSKLSVPASIQNKLLNASPENSEKYLNDLKEWIKQARIEGNTLFLTVNLGGEDVKVRLRIIKKDGIVTGIEPSIENEDLEVLRRISNYIETDGTPLSEQTEKANFLEKILSLIPEA